MNWMKAMKPSQTDNRSSSKVGEVLRKLQKRAGITKAQSMAYIQKHGESSTAPVISHPLRGERLSRSVKARKKRQQKWAAREAQAKENADARARAKANDDANDGEETDTLFAGTFRLHTVKSSDEASEEDAEEFSGWEGFSDDDGEVMDVELLQPFPLKVVIPAPATNNST